MTWPFTRVSCQCDRLSVFRLIHIGDGITNTGGVSFQNALFTFKVKSSHNEERRVLHYHSLQLQLCLLFTPTPSPRALRWARVLLVSLSMYANPNNWIKYLPSCLLSTKFYGSLWVLLARSNICWLGEFLSETITIHLFAVCRAVELHSLGIF